MSAPTCEVCGRQTAGSKFCSGDCEVQHLMHEDAKQKNKTCGCRRCKLKADREGGKE